MNLIARRLGITVICFCASATYMQTLFKWPSAFGGLRVRYMRLLVRCSASYAERRLRCDSLIAARSRLETAMYFAALSHFLTARRMRAALPGAPVRR